MGALPEISVILPVYNAQLFLKEAIDSVLQQSFSNFELIIINDGSTDKSHEIIIGYKDERIIYREQKNSGLAATLNNAIHLARAEYIARMDNDDVSLPDRFEKQLKFMKEHPQTGLLGTATEIIDENGKTTSRFMQHPCGNVALKLALMFNNPFVHASVMFKKSVFVKAGEYSVDQNYFEDYNLWSRMARVSNIANLSQRLLKYREVSTSMSRTTSDYSKRVINQAVINIQNYCPSFSKEDIELCVACINGYAKEQDFKRAKNLLESLLEQLWKALAKREVLPENDVSSESEKYMFNFKRHYLNSIIESGTSSEPDKLIARLKRRILFLKQGSK